MGKQMKSGKRSIYLDFLLILITGRSLRVESLALHAVEIRPPHINSAYPTTSILTQNYT